MIFKFKKSIYIKNGKILFVFKNYFLCILKINFYVS